MNCVETARLAGGHWRLFRVLHLSLGTTWTGCTSIAAASMVCSCPTSATPKRQFKSRTELFIGPRHHDTMGETYDVRSDNRAARLEFVKKLEMRVSESEFDPQHTPAGVALLRCSTALIENVVGCVVRLTRQHMRRRQSSSFSRVQREFGAIWPPDAGRADWLEMP